MRILPIRDLTFLVASLLTCTNQYAGKEPQSNGDQNLPLPATQTELNRPFALATDDSGNLWISTLMNDKIHRLNLKTGLMSILKTTAPVQGVASMQIDASGKLLAAALSVPCRVVQINVQSGIVTEALADTSGTCPGKDAKRLEAGNNSLFQVFSEPQAVAHDKQGNLFIVDGGDRPRILRIDWQSRHVRTVASGRRLKGALSIAITDQGNFFISRSGKGVGSKGILRLNPATGQLSPLNGSSFAGSKEIWAESDAARRIIPDPLGNLYIIDASRIFYIDLAKHVVSPVAGTTEGFSGDGGLATKAQLFWPCGLALDAAGNLYIADSENQRLRKVDAKTHIITTVAGNGLPHHVPGTIEVSL
jgi:sugar lactone lactonase YvrE